MTRPNYLCVHLFECFHLSNTEVWDRFGRLAYLPVIGSLLSAMFDKEHCLQVDYTIRSSSQSHPFGDTFVEEPLEDVLDDSFLYRLDGKTVELEDLHRQFGRDWIDSFLEDMPTTRISPLVQDYDPED